MKTTRRFQPRSLCAAAVAVALVLPSTLHATDGTWTANNNNGNWSNTNNWDGGIIASGIDATATFAPILTGNKFMYLDSNRTIGNIAWSGLNYSYEIRPSSAQTLTLQVSAGTPTINCTPSHAFIISAKIGGTQGFAKTGSGPLTLSGTNTYSGATTISAGTINLTGSLTGGTAISTSSTGTLNESAAGVISGAASFTQGSSGTSLLAGNNTYSGATTVQAGTLTLSANRTLPGASPVVLAGGTLDMGSFTNATGTLAVTGDSALALGAGSLSFSDSSAVSWTGNLTLTGTLSATTLRFGTGTNALTAGQLARINLNGLPVRLDANGYLGSPVKALQVETAADGSGVVVPAQSLTAGQSLTAYAIARDVNGAFLANVSASWGLTNATGFVVSGDLTPAANGKSAVFTAGSYGTAQIIANGSAPVSVPSGTITVNSAPVPSATRPFIWATAAERQDILNKITTNAWATSLANQLIARVAGDLAAYEADRDGYLRQLPVIWSNTPTRFVTNLVARGLQTWLNPAQDCSVIYYLTGNPRYARMSADVLQNMVATLYNMIDTANSNGFANPNGDWGEARWAAMQSPIIYDFLHGYLQTNQVWDVASGGLTLFSFPNAQSVFYTYWTNISQNPSGLINISALQRDSVMHNALALDDPLLRSNALNSVVDQGNGVSSLAEFYPKFDGPSPYMIWPEATEYADTIKHEIYEMSVIERVDPARQVYSRFPGIPASAQRLQQLKYPNDTQIICYGAGPHDWTTPGAMDWLRAEMIHHTAKQLGQTNLMAAQGGVLAYGLNTGYYDRSVLPDESTGGGSPNNVLALLWGEPVITSTPTPPPIFRTDTAPYAGIALQRNHSPDGNPTNALMSFVTGGSYTHGHASGMAMELYGMGWALGMQAHGRGLYYEAFAMHNCVVVNGYSRGHQTVGGEGVNNLQVVAMEPSARQSAVSSNLSFTCTSFSDTDGTGAEGTEQRTMAIIRTSPTTGYYVDIFRSLSTVTNTVVTTTSGVVVTNQFHDWIYHNIGSTLTLTDNSGTPLSLTSQPNRFTNDNANAEKAPGWGIWTNTMATGTVTNFVRAQFYTLPNGGVPIYMDLRIPGDTNREYAAAQSLAIDDAPPPYDSALCPTLVVRKYGSAWNNPFVVVFEPHGGSAANGSVTNVTTLVQSNIVVGVKVQSLVGGRSVVQYVLSNTNATGTYTNPAIGLIFKGRFGVATDNGDGTTTLYLGSGSSLSYRGNVVTAVGGTNVQAEARFTPGQPPVIVANQSVSTVAATAPVVTLIARDATGTISLWATGSNGVPYSLWSSTNLTLGNWKLVNAGAVSNSPFLTPDSGTASNQSRFYRFSTP